MPDMPTLADSKHQTFADALLSGSTGRDAAIKAGFAEKSATQRATKLRKRPDVAAYLAAARQDMQDTAKLDRDSYVRMIGEKIEKAQTNKNDNAVMTGMKLLGQALDHIDSGSKTDITLTLQDGRTRAEREADVLATLDRIGLLPNIPQVINGECSVVPEISSREAS